MADDADNVYFKKLFSMIPAHFHHKEAKEEDGEVETGDVLMQTVEEKPAKKKKKGQKSAGSDTATVSDAVDTAKEEKIRGKKESKQKKKKTKEKETKTKINVQEAQEKLRARIAELKAKRALNITSSELQEQKRLERKQRRLLARGKHKNKKKEGSDGKGGEEVNGVTPGSESATATLPLKTSKPVVTKEGKLVFSKFDFSKSGDKEKTSGLAGKDYKRILARLEHREAKVAKLKETDATEAEKLEQKFVWQDVLMKAKGQKIKDDPSKLKKAIKRKDKMKEVRVKKWDQRKGAEEKGKKDRQKKRQDNLQKRRDDKKEKHRKKLIKKGRILPGF